MSRFGYGSMRLLVALTIGTALALAISSVAAADTELGHDLKVGRHRLRDGASKAGVKCQTFADALPVGASILRVRAPRVFARDRTGGRDRQKVGWQVVVRFGDDGRHFRTLFTSSVQGAMATDVSAAAFTARDVSLPDLEFVRVRIRMYWFRPDDPELVEGASLHEVDYYDIYHDGGFRFQNGPAGYCEHAFP